MSTSCKMGSHFRSVSWPISSPMLVTPHVLPIVTSPLVHCTPHRCSSLAPPTSQLICVYSTTDLALGDSGAPSTGGLWLEVTHSDMSRD